MINQDNAARLTSFIFCYDAYATKETFSKWADGAIANLTNKNKANSWNYPDYIFCLKKNIMLERRNITGGIQYWNLTSKNQTSNIVQLKILESLFQCVINGCGRLRKVQGIILET